MKGRTSDDLNQIFSQRINKMTKAKVEYQSYIHSREWQQKSRKMRGIMSDRCAVFPFLKSNNTHHMTYANLGREVLLRDCIPLNGFVHNGIVHPIARLFHRRHDIHSVRFLLNWLVLRPSLMFWLTVFGFASLWAMLISKRLVAVISFGLAALFGHAILSTPTASIRDKCIFWFITYVFLVCSLVFDQKK